MGILEQVIKDLRPSKDISKKADISIKKINNEIKKQKIKAVCVKGGSIAKNTHLKDDHDCDLFVKFDISYKDENISKLLEKILKKFRVNLIHGSRDYFQLKSEGITYEIIPVLNIKKAEDAENVTDFSPLHVNWVKKSPRMLDEIRLSKAFCKAQDIYGAESYIKGFSGHVLDILTIYHRGFVKLLKASQKWKEKEVIDFYNFHKGKALKNLNISKTHSPLIVIDPIEPYRNAAAALDKEKFHVFKKKAKEFLNKPSKEFFKRKKFSLAEIKKKAKNDKLVVLKITALPGKEDIVGSKLLKCLEFIEKQFKLNDFKVKLSGWDWDKKKKALFYFVIEKELLPGKKLRIGPPLKNKKHSKMFKRKHKNCFVKKGRLYAQIKREFRDGEKFIKYLIKQDYIKERVKNIKRG